MTMRRGQRHAEEATNPSVWPIRFGGSLFLTQPRDARVLVNVPPQAPEE